MAETITAILSQLKSSAESEGFLFVGSKGEETPFSFAEIAVASEVRGRLLLGSGLKPRDRAAIILQDNQEFVLSFLACISVNVIPVPIYPPPLMGNKDRQLETAANIISSSRAHATITSTKIAEAIKDFDSSGTRFNRVITIASLDAIEPDDSELDLPVASDTCFLQFTSGSTADPKGVLVSHANLIANTNAIVHHGLQAKPDRDRGVSWLPLFHDMGLIGFVLAPIVGRIPVVLLPTMSFVRRPSLWMQAIDKYRGTISFGPNFAFALATKRAARTVAAGIDLSCLRVLGCGAEPISPNIMRDFVTAFEPAKLNAKVLTPSYGMAEASLAVSFEPLNQGLSTLSIEPKVYREQARIEIHGGNGGDKQEVVACGKVIADHEVFIFSESGEALDENQVGEIVGAGPRVSSGYFENPQATTASFREGRLYTQDLGFLRDGRLYICGRKKDLLILNGRNYHPQDLEWAIEQHEGLRQGSVVCFTVTGD